MAQTKYKVKWGDTLSEIVCKEEFKDLIPGSTISQKVDYVKKLNPGLIKDVDLIKEGWTIVIAGEAAEKPKENKTYKVTIPDDWFGLLNDNTLFAQWQWNQEGTEKYQLRWMYYVNGKAFYGNSSANSVDENDPEASQVSTYSIPAEAEKVTFQVKPIADETASWEADWSTIKTHYFIGAPGAPEPVLDGLTLTATLENIEVADDSDQIEFQLVKDNKSTVGKNVFSNISTGYASAKWENLKAGSKYKVRCRAVRSGSNSATSDWSPYSKTVGTIPTPSSGFTKYRAESETSVYLEWGASNTAESYEIWYISKEDITEKDIVDYAEIAPDKFKKVQNIEVNYREIADLTTGNEYFFIVRAVNTEGASDWSKEVSVIVGEEPAAPTTWSSVTTVNAGDPLNLYWVHNSIDGSSETFAELEMYINGVKEIIPTLEKSQDEDEKDKTSVYSVDTSRFTEVTEIRWRVKTSGITQVFGDWSIERQIWVYPEPELTLSISNTEGGDLVDTLGSLPLYISATTAADGQIPIEYYVTVTANGAYDTVDNIGNNKTVSAGDLVYSGHTEVNSESDTSLKLALEAGDIDLENNISYTVTCLVSMDTGLTAEASVDFTVAWSDDLYWPNATIKIDKETLVAHINPYCTDLDGNLIDDVLLSVYRREPNGTFTKIADELQNDGSIGVTDPHPSLDYARYRIVSTSKSTGAISYYDRPGYLVGEKSAVIQWDETWSEFDISNDDEVAQTPWTGSILKLPYNLDVTDNYSIDVSHVKYIGREHPVAYYGTQVGETSTWNLQIRKNDTETLHTLRRLARWMGDVYVREPSGNGYWASISISLPNKHCEVTIPVTINITRVEGGV